MYTIDKIKPTKFASDEHWTVTADLRGLETFENFYSNHDIVDYLKYQNIISVTDDEDSEMCQFFCYFKNEQDAQEFIQKLALLIDLRKESIKKLHLQK